MWQYEKTMFFMKNKGDSLGMQPTKSVLYSESQENIDQIPFLKIYLIRNTGSGWLALESWANQSENDGIRSLRLSYSQLPLKDYDFMVMRKH